MSMYLFHGSSSFKSKSNMFQIMNFQEFAARSIPLNVSTKLVLFGNLQMLFSWDIAQFEF